MTIGVRNLGSGNLYLVLLDDGWGVDGDGCCGDVGFGCDGVVVGVFLDDGEHVELGCVQFRDGVFGWDGCDGWGERVGVELHGCEYGVADRCVGVVVGCVGGDGFDVAFGDDDVGQ